MNQLLMLINLRPWTILDPPVKDLNLGIEDLYYLASITTKYNFERLSKWAMNRLVKKCFINTGDNSIIDG
jgi:hypothetical protein